MMASVTNAIAELGIEIIHIPGGCTGLTQPLDVGINKPFKSRVRVLWEEWMRSITQVYCMRRLAAISLVGGGGCLGVER